MDSKTLTIMFTDIKDFTSRTSSQSRKDHLILLEMHEELIKPPVLRNQGKIIKSIGDSFLVTFESPTNALLAALDIQHNIDFYNKKVPDADKRMELKIGLAAGEVNFIQNDVSGEAVNMAARIVEMAGAGEVLFSESVYLTMNKSEIPHKFVGENTLKGIPEPVKTYKLLLHDEPPEKKVAKAPVQEPNETPLLATFDVADGDASQKLDRDRLKQIFDFTNVEIEKKYENNLPEDKGPKPVHTTTETLELDTSRRGEKTVAEDSAPHDPHIEHSKELLIAIREEKTKKKRFKILFALGFVAFVVGLFLLHNFFVKPDPRKEEEALKKSLEESPVLRALQKRKETPTPLPKSKPKPIKSIEYGKLRIKTYPSKAGVWLDGKKVNGRTPLTIKKVMPEKSHTLVIRKKGYQPYRLFFDIIPGEEKIVDARLPK